MLLSDFNKHMQKLEAKYPGANLLCIAGPRGFTGNISISLAGEAPNDVHIYLQGILPEDKDAYIKTLKDKGVAIDIHKVKG